MAVNNSKYLLLTNRVKLHGVSLMMMIHSCGVGKEVILIELVLLREIRNRELELMPIG